MSDEVEIRFKVLDASPSNIARILRDAADKFEQGRTRFAIADASGLIGGAVLNTAEEIAISERRLAYLMEDAGV